MIKTCLRCVRSCHRLLLICDKLSSFGVELGCAGLALSSRLTKSTSVIGMGRIDVLQRLCYCLALDLNFFHFVMCSNFLNFAKCYKIA